MTKAASKRRMSPRLRTEAKWGLGFIAPTIIGLLILNYYPIFETVYESFCKTGDFGIHNQFIGFENYKNVFTDPEVYRTLFNSFRYAAVSLVLTIASSLVLAVLLNRKMHGRSVYRTIYFLPMVCAPAAVAIDGSTGIHSFFHITIPLLSPTLFFIIQTGIIGALQMFDLPFMLMDQSSRAWPTVKTITYLFYEYAFEHGDKGYGSTIVVFMILVIGILTVILQKTEKKWVHYD